MDDQRVGAVLRAVRRRRGWRQSDVAAKAGVSQAWISLVERGHLGPASIDRLRRMARAIDVALVLEARWRGADLARLLDEDHARLVERMARSLREWGWTLELEWSFNHFGERGVVDLVGWHPLASALLVVEVKTRLVDLQDLLAQLGRKARILGTVSRRERGWSAGIVGVVLVASDTTRNRRVVMGHEATFRAALPARNRAVRAWLRSPEGGLRGLWFVRPSSGSDAARSRARKGWRF